MVGSTLGLVLAGCGGRPEIQAVPTNERGLKELARLYRNFTAKHKRPPKSLKELNVQGQQYPFAVSMIKSGDLIVQWGAPVSAEGETADAVLAYVKTVPDQGGNVLMQDSRTIKRMTAQEFKTAPKAVPR
jgi:hypothetical protein